MAEILLSLTIIGVVAAITLPSLTGNINERTWNTQRKALYARMSQAIALMPALNGYGTLNEDENGSVMADTAAETFVTEGLSKVLKINNICDSEHLADCGLPDKITTFNGEIITPFPKTLVTYNDSFSYVDKPMMGQTSVNLYTYEQADTKAAAFETVNGESIAVFYNPRCSSQLNSFAGHVQAFMCANFLYDLNGNKGPNTVGKDIGFISVLYPTDSVVVAPMPSVRNAAERVSYNDSLRACRGESAESRVPNIEELFAMFYNNPLLGVADSSTYFWSSTSDSAELAWLFRFDSGTAYKESKTWGQGVVRCVKR